MRLLLSGSSTVPAPADLDALGDTALYAAYAPPREPWLRANMVTTLDGSATGADGRSGGINTEADHVVFELLRAQSHAVVVGAGTLRDEGYSSLSVDERWRGLRQARRPAARPAPRRRQQPRSRAASALPGRRRHGPARDRGRGPGSRRRPVEPRRAARHRLRRRARRPGGARRRPAPTRLDAAAHRGRALLAQDPRRARPPRRAVPHRRPDPRRGRPPATAGRSRRRASTSSCTPCWSRTARCSAGGVTRR